MKPPSCAWLPPCWRKPARNGKREKFTSTWKTKPRPQFKNGKAFYRKKLAPPRLGSTVSGHLATLVGRRRGIVKTGAQEDIGTLPVPVNNRTRNGKRTCKTAGQEEYHEKPPKRPTLVVG